MRKAPIKLRDLRRRIYVKAKAEPEWRFWGLYGHVCKLETLREAYALAKRNDGSPGIDGVTFEAIEAGGVESFLEQIREELVTGEYLPLRNRRQEIPKDGGKVRVLGIPAIRDRVVQGALKLIVEPIFEADFQAGSYGYRPQRSAQAAVKRVAEAIVSNKTRVIDVDLSSYFDNIRHHLLLEKVARRVNDGDVLALLKKMLKANGKKGVPQGGVISPLLSNVYLNEVDRMLERAKETTREGQYTYVEYVRWADDLVILVDAYQRHNWLLAAVDKRLREELELLQVVVNEDKSRTVDLAKGDSFGIPGVRVSARAQSAGSVATPVQPADEDAERVVAKAQEDIPTLSIATGGTGGGDHQPDPARVGELLRDWAFEPVLWSRSQLGGEEDTAAYDARQETPGIRLEEVE